MRTENSSPEESLHLQQSLNALLFCSVALALGCSALRELISAESNWYTLFSYLRALGGIIATIFLFVQIALSHRDRKNFSRSPIFEGFIQHASQRARTISWVVTFLSLILLIEIIDNGSDLPPDFFLKIVVSLQLATFGISYFFITSTVDESE